MASSHSGEPIATTVNYESIKDRDDSQYQVAWSKMMDQGKYRKSSSYKKIEVMMFHFARGCDGEGDATGGGKVKNEFEDSIMEEVNKLGDVFTGFGYNVTTRTLDNKVNVQSYVNLIMADWVYKNDSRETLLIVYYGGHGRPGSNSGELQFHGSVHKSSIMLIHLMIAGLRALMTSQGR